ncbi:hypothetical protein HPP92_008377 [Vanilla planifolia]|uniref:Uncharacterized protein n=1 Tax=Vanilla planifolia TaxID=51239 RepID=A0A835RHW4_VANPL|nr:hypothetical protein HPP92_008377 [Vanilla planifolia]
MGGLLKKICFLSRSEENDLPLDGFFVIAFEQERPLLRPLSGLAKSSRLLASDKEEKDLDFPWKCFDKPLLAKGRWEMRQDISNRGPSSSSGSGGKAEEDASSNISDDDDPTELAECVLKEEKEPRSSSCSSMVPWLLGGEKEVSILQKICLELPYYVLLLNHAPSTFSEEKNRNGRLDKLINGFIYTGLDFRRRRGKREIRRYPFAGALSLSLSLSPPFSFVQGKR